MILGFRFAPPQGSMLSPAPQAGFMKTNLFKTHLVLILVLLLAPCVAYAQGQPQLSNTDRVRLAEAFRLGDKLGDQLWAGWRQAPFAVLLVTPEHEFLIRHPKPSNDFVLVNYDPLLQSKVTIGREHSRKICWQRFLW